MLATCSASTFFVFGQRELFGAKTGWKTILHLPFLMGLGVGICLNNAKAVLEACWSAIRKQPSEFVRTPKYGVTGHSRRSQQISQSATYFAGELTSGQPGKDDAVSEGNTAAGANRTKADFAAEGMDCRKNSASNLELPPARKSFLSFNRLVLPILEIAFGCYMSCCIFISLYYQWGRASVPFLVIFAGGYFYVGVNTLWVLCQMQASQTADEALAAAVDNEPVSSL